MDPPPAYYQRRRKRGTELCQILLRNGDIEADDIRRVLRVQEEEGGQVGRILVAMKLCSEKAIAHALIQQLQARVGTSVNTSVAARENPAVAGLKVPCSPALTTLALILTDLVALSLSVGVALAVNLISRDALHSVHLLMLPAIAVCIIAFSGLGLYSCVAPSPPDEIRKITWTLSLVVLGFAGISLLAQRGLYVLSAPALFLWWATGVFFAPIARAIVRGKFASKLWWGHPVVVLGAGKMGRTLVRTLRAQPRCGLKPVLMLDDDRTKLGTLRARIGKESDIEVGSATEMKKTLVSDSTRRAASDLVNDVERATLLQEINASARSSSEAMSPKDPPRRASTSSIPEVLDRRARPRGMFAEVEGIPVVGEFSLAPILAKRLQIPYAIIAMPGVSSQRLLELTDRVGGMFSHILVIPDMVGFASQGVPSKDIGGVLGIEVRQQLLLPGPWLAKRALDMTLTFLGGLCILPIIALIALLIKLDSPGPIFYYQNRLGRHGKRFKAAKFRSMYGDGEARLKAVLESDPRLKAEYEEFHKLNRDPRVTRIGTVLRKYSLDELPQLWNVMNGDMSLVGPRPYLEREIPDMNQREKIILRAMPGMTGLWQVSDRNATGFAERLAMDVHYVRNWSPWLDIYILARTIGVVLRGTGV